MHPVETVFSSKRFHVRSQFIPTFLFDIHRNARMRVFAHVSVSEHSHTNPWTTFGEETNSQQ